MDIWDALRTFVRRWYVALPLLVVSIVLGTVVGAKVATEYTASTSVLLVVPASAVTPEAAQSTGIGPDEPLALLTYSNAMRAISETSVEYLDSVSTRGRLADQGVPSDYVVEQRTDGPVVFIEVTAADPDVARRSVETLVTELESDLAARQELFAASPNPRIVTQIVAPPDRVEASSGSRTRATVLLAFALIVASVGLVALIDGALQRRQRSWSAQQSVEDDASWLDNGQLEAPVSVGER